MIVRDQQRIPPQTWTDADVRELLDHSHDLAMNGNPAGFLMVDALKDLDVDAARAWIAENGDRVLTVWQFQVRSIY